MDQNLQAIRDEREKDYGDARECHGNIGLAWTAILRQYGYDIEPLTPKTVATMMVALKLVRLTTTAKKQQDTFDDAHVYLHFAEEFSE